MRSLKTIQKSAWKYMSLYSRMRKSHHNGQVQCCCCGVFKHWKEMDAGHFIHASKSSPVTYDDRNINPQCPACNRFGREDAPVKYTRYMIEHHGTEVIDELIRDKHKSLRKSELEEIEQDLIAKVKDLEKEIS